MPTLTPYAFQALLRQDVDELCSSVFVTQDDLKAWALRRSNPNVLDQLLGLGKQVGAVERQFTDPNGTLAKIEGRLTSLENHRSGNSIERGGKAFQDIGPVAAWVQTFEDKHMFRYCVDMVTLVMLCADPYKTIAKGMATAAAAHMAEYNNLIKMQISLS